jgi:hypothetical protein
MKKNNKSKKPYILIINKFKNNNKLVNVDNYKKINLHYLVLNLIMTQIYGMMIIK